MWSILLISLATLGYPFLVSGRPAPKVPKYVTAPHRHQQRHYSHQHPPSGSKSIPQKVTAPYTNIFNSLTNDEAASVIAFLHTQGTLNLTVGAEAGAWDNSIMVIDLYAPNKSDALPYLQGDGDKPGRWALASISFGATPEPNVQEFVVGPLPLGDDAGYHLNTFGTHGEGAKIRIYDMDDSAGFAYGHAMDMKDILHDLLDSESPYRTVVGTIAHEL